MKHIYSIFIIIITAFCISFLEIVVDLFGLKSYYKLHYNKVSIMFEICQLFLILMLMNSISSIKDDLGKFSLQQILLYVAIAYMVFNTLHFILLTYMRFVQVSRSKRDHFDQLNLL